MKYEIIFLSLFKEHLDKHKKSGSKILVKKIEALIAEIRETPRYGTGHPEHLKHCAGETWSRQITGKHRLIYEIQEDKLIVIAISAYGHYGNK